LVSDSQAARLPLAALVACGHATAVGGHWGISDVSDVSVSDVSDVSDWW
jgi:hypothetical protein